MKRIMSGVFGLCVGVVISSISSYHLSDWEWWVATMSIIIVGATYANIKK